MDTAGERWVEFARQGLQMAELALKEGIYNLMFAQAFGGSDPRFDLNGDGSVGFTDFLMFAGQFGKSGKWAVW